MSHLLFCIKLYVADSLVKISAAARTVLSHTAELTPSDKPGASWSDKVMAVKKETASQHAPLPQDEVEGVDDDEWVSCKCDLMPVTVRVLSLMNVVMASWLVSHLLT